MCTPVPVTHWTLFDLPQASTVDKFKSTIDELIRWPCPLKELGQVKCQCFRRVRVWLYWMRCVTQESVRLVGVSGLTGGKWETSLCKWEQERTQ